MTWKALGLLLVSFACQAGERAERIILHVGAPSCVSAVRLSLPFAVKVAFSQNQLMILRADRTVDAPLLAKLRELPCVTSVSGDFEVMPDLSVAKGIGTWVPDSWWPQKYLSLDLMSEEIQSKHLRSAQVSSRLVMLGSGLNSGWKDGVARSEYMQSRSVDGASGDVARDPWIAAAVGTKIGASSHSNSVVYQISEAGKIDRSKFSNIVEALERGCEENPDAGGVTLITLGWGSAQLDRADIFQDVLMDLANRACLVFQSAPVRWNETTETAETHEALPSVRVGPRGLMPAEQKALASESLPAPGAIAIPGLESYRGAGIAAHWVGGVAAELLGVLKANDKFTALSPLRRSSLLKAILSRSVHDGVLDAYVAIRVAQAWSQSGEARPPTPTSQECRPGRIALSICPDPSGQIAEATLNWAIAQGDLGTAAQALSRLGGRTLSSRAIEQLDLSFFHKELDFDLGARLSDEIVKFALQNAQPKSTHAAMRWLETALDNPKAADQIGNWFEIALKLSPWSEVESMLLRRVVEKGAVESRIMAVERVRDLAMLQTDLTNINDLESHLFERLDESATNYPERFLEKLYQNQTDRLSEFLAAGDLSSVTPAKLTFALRMASKTKSASTEKNEFALSALRVVTQSSWNLRERGSVMKEAIEVLAASAKEHSLDGLDDLLRTPGEGAHLLGLLKELPRAELNRLCPIGSSCWENEGLQERQLAIDTTEGQVFVGCLLMGEESRCCTPGAYPRQLALKCTGEMVYSGPGCTITQRGRGLASSSGEQWSCHPK